MHGTFFKHLKFCEILVFRKRCLRTFINQTFMQNVSKFPHKMFEKYDKNSICMVQFQNVLTLKVSFPESAF